jgi:diguanylate cyclase (GGDEF)-like protein
MAGFVAAKRALWLERLGARWMARWSRTSAAAASVVTVLLVGALHQRFDRLVGHAIDPMVLYLVPIGFAAWVAGPRIGVALAGLAALVNLTVAAWPSGRAVPPWVLLVGLVLDLLVFLGAALAFALLRWHLEREHQLSSTDPLTGIGNHRAFEDAVRREIARGERRAAPLSLVYIDLDRFKELNDSRGHPVGDALLRIVGGALEASVRTVDSAARVGGDEFAVLLPDTGPEACRQVVTRIRDRLRSSTREAGFWNTFSVGAVTFERPPGDAASAVAAVDRAMYQVKRSGRDGVHHDVVPGGSTGNGLARRRTGGFDTFRPV